MPCLTVRDPVSTSLQGGDLGVHVGEDSSDGCLFLDTGGSEF